MSTRKQDFKVGIFHLSFSRLERNCMALRKPKEKAVHSWEAMKRLEYFLNIDIEIIMGYNF